MGPWYWITTSFHLHSNISEYEKIIIRAEAYEGVKWRRKSKKEKKEEIKWTGGFFGKSDSGINRIRYP